MENKKIYPLGKTKDELAEIFEKNEPNKNDGTVWDNPTLFDDAELPDIPASLLPHPLCDFATALACASETPEALSVMVILGVLASIISKSYIISPKDGGAKQRICMLLLHAARQQ